MKFAINWSPEAAALYDEGTIDFDMYKCPDWERVVNPAREQKPSYVHFPLTIGRGQHTDWDFDSIHRWLDCTDTTFVNCHIVPADSHFDRDISVSDLTEALIPEVQTLVNEFGTERVIIENCPHFAGNVERGYLPQGIQPRLIQRIVETTGCGFLLDLSHAKLTCTFLGKDFHRYLASLPIEHIRELHITGIGAWTNGTVGDHTPMTAADWHTLDYAIRQIGEGKWATPQVMTFEYGGIEKLRDLCGSDRQAIATQVPRLAEMAARV